MLVNLVADNVFCVGQKLTRFETLVVFLFCFGTVLMKRLTVCLGLNGDDILNVNMLCRSRFELTNFPDANKLSQYASWC